MTNLIDQTEAELAAVRSRRLFWEEQAQLHDGTELGERARRIAAGYDVQLDQLSEVLAIVRKRMANDKG